MRVIERLSQTEKKKLSAIMIGVWRIASSCIPQVLSTIEMSLDATLEPAWTSRLILKFLTRRPVFKSLDGTYLSRFDAAYILTAPGVHSA